MEFFWDKPSWGWSWVWAAVVLVLPSLVAFVVKVVSNDLRPRPVQDFLTGKDGRWSTSKTAVFLWTYAVWFAFVAFLIHEHDVPTKDQLHEEYFIVLGIPTAAALIAKGVVQSKVESGTLTKDVQAPETSVVAGAGQLVSDDRGRADLLDFQYFGFNLILIGYFLVKFFETPESGLPDLPDSLLALTGVAATAYVGKKGLDKEVGPTLWEIVPRQGAAGTRVKITGVNLATAAATNVDVLFGNLEGQNTTVTVPKHAEVQSDVPAGLQPGEVEVRVVAYDGRPSNPLSFTVVA